MLYLGYLIYDAVGHPAIAYSGYNLGGIDRSGEVPNPNLRKLTDPDTPQNKFTYTGNGKTKRFSDKFEQDYHTPTGVK
ncbi:hypothetical protein K525DRAFT_269528 [Schizophyllum commune Loenen D]|nr:hypothetical protein K525DRAFT_269528 [Schizophyllum commune Loenen D]